MCKIEFEVTARYLLIVFFITVIKQVRTQKGPNEPR